MNEKLLEFSNLLRRNGLRVSLAENMDSFRALSVVGLGDRETVRATLRASMVKRTIDIPAFEQLFALFFSGLADAIAEATAATRGALGLDDPDFQRLLEELERLLRERGIELSPLARALLAADGGRLERLLREAGERARVGDIQQGFQEGRFAHAVAGALGLGALARELERLKAELEGSADAGRLAEYLDRRLQDLNDMIKAMVRGELERQDVGRRDHERLAALADKSFFYLTEEEIRRMQEAVQKLAQRLRNVISIRRRRARRGKFDPSGTLRRNLQYGGVPFRIVWDHRKKEKPQVMVLCDVSDSVRNVSRFMLQFVYSLQDLYSKVRSFVFVAEVGEITRLFEDQDINQAIETALRGDVINVYAHSDFGRAFKAFHRDHIAAVNKRTTVIVLGDARNNYNLPHDWVLKEIRQRAKQLIWLNPENRMTWGFGDSEMDHYAPHCTLVEECRNLGQLYRVIDRLVAA
ncbi:MAG: VWA domain-containing protein [Deltaproteobacteria bacterium]|nr:MAG: VWA domain-containing protein [Deltaproteobacteria bacterium]TMB44139.1 MAG: VWA domain-containing protein [Deltaproteobacteria bacterium]